MRNAALPRELTVTPAAPVATRRFWRNRRRAVQSTVPAAPPPAAVLRRESAHPGRLSHHPTAEHPVLVHDFSMAAVDLRSRLPLDVCGHYRLHSDAHGPMLRGSRVRVVSCQRQPCGLYAIGAEICR